MGQLHYTLAFNVRMRLLQYSLNSWRDISEGYVKAPGIFCDRLSLICICCACSVTLIVIQDDIFPAMKHSLINLMRYLAQVTISASGFGATDTNAKGCSKRGGQLLDK